MSPDELLWSAPQRGGLMPAEWEVVVDHLTRQLGIFLGREVCRVSDASLTPGKSCGFSVEFWTPTAIGSPLDFQVCGTFGAADYDGQYSKYIGVQGWLFPYIAGQRIATTADNHNHIFLRYAKVDASDNDWEMDACIGNSAWRSLGWSPDEYGEFQAFDTWNDFLKSL